MGRAVSVEQEQPRISDGRAHQRSLEKVTRHLLCFVQSVIRMDVQIRVGGASGMKNSGRRFTGSQEIVKRIASAVMRLGPVKQYRS
jgi:hypothetical protein